MLLKSDDTQINVLTKTRNEPKRPETCQNELKPAETSQNNPSPAEMTPPPPLQKKMWNDPKPPKILKLGKSVFSTGFRFSNFDPKA